MSPPRHTLSAAEERASEEPTRDRMVHPSPCEALQRFREQYITQRTLVWGVLCGCGLFAGYLWTRYDALAEGAQTRAVAISAISTKLDGIDKSLERIEASVASIRAGKP